MKGTAMGSGREVAGQRESLLRRVAIVLSSLPNPVATRLLEQFSPDARGKLQQAIRDLGQVEPWERRLALQSFRGSINEQQSPTGRGSGVEDEVTFSSTAAEASAAAQRKPQVAAQSDSGQAPNQSTSDLRKAPLAFLRDVPDESLIGLVVGEHPQTIALVLASIEPAQAARVLPRLHPVQRQEAISRIGRLGEIPVEAVEEIAEHLTGRVARDLHGDSLSNGQRALSAIFAQLAPSPAEDSSLDAASPYRAEALNRGKSLHRAEGRHPIEQPDDESALQQILRLRRLRDDLDAQSGSVQTQSAKSSLHADPAEDPQRVTAASHGDAKARDAVSSERLDIRDAAFSDTARPVAATEEDHRNEWLSTDEIHRHLLGLSPQELCQTLGKVDTRQALLALCGLPTEVAEAVLAVLPRAHGKTVRRQLAALGSLRLREIDEAKEVVARASWGETIDVISAKTAVPGTAQLRPIAA